MKVNCRIFSNLSNQTYCKTIGARGAPGVPAVTPVEGLTPGLVTVSRAAAPQATQDVSERLQRHSLALKRTKAS